MTEIIDLRSDTITRPSKAMRKAMADAEVGDDVFKEDPTVNKLEEYAAELLGKEASLFVTSGVMGNQLCINVLSNPGDELICERDSHIFNYESGSPAKLSGVQLLPVDGTDGIMDPEKIESFIRPQSAYYMPSSKIISVENTHNRAGGIVQPLNSIKSIGKLARKYKLYYHLDGARLWNASVASGVSIKDFTKDFDTVSCCFSKGLGAPVGSVIAGTREFIKKAYGVRKSWGGGMRQAGIIAAAALYALKNNIERLEEDHRKATFLAERIADLSSLELNMASVQTNIVIFKPRKLPVKKALEMCKQKGLLLSVGKVDSLRAITHMDVSFKQIEKAKSIITDVFG